MSSLVKVSEMGLLGELCLSRMWTIPHRRHGLTDGQRAGRKRWCGECGDESEQERSRTGGGAGRREQLAPCPSAGAGTRRQAGETELRRGRCGGSDVAGTPTQWPRKPSNPSLHARERASAIFENRAKYSSPLFEIGEVTLKEDSGIIQGCLCVNRSAVTHHRN